ncbi:MAG: sodium-dependent transporter [Gammaproteobacteria bacterium]|nr:sodium-dependent transporter [Gammaproteobacteria bacterium]
MMARSSIHGQWSSRWVFILAATGSAVGLGNIWRFPYLTGENGGAAFVLLYLGCIAAVGVPLLMAEIMLGRRGRQSPIHSFESLAQDESLSRNWRWLGAMGVVAGFMILSFYSVVAGWSLAYVFYTGSGMFADITVEGAGERFNAMIGSAETLLAWHTVFMVMTAIIVGRGVQSGLEQAVKYLMPALFILLIAMVGYAMGTGDFGAAISYLFHPDFSKLTNKTVLEALGQAFFSLSLGMGAILTYGSYLSDNTSIPHTSVIIALADTAVALLAGLAVFPIVFAYGLEPSSGPGLVFVSLTLAFAHMPFGQVFGCLFFILLTVAAWTSAISLLEPATAWLVERLKWRRRHAVIWTGTIAWVMGIGSLLSFNHWDSVKFFGKNFFDSMEFISTSVMLPVGGLLIAVFAGWRMSRASSSDELRMQSTLGYSVWRVLTRYVAPAGVVLVFLNALGIL